MDDGDFFAAVGLGVLERVAAHAQAPFARHHRHRLRHRLGVVADLEGVIHPDVQPFGVLADDDEIDAFVAAPGDDCLRRPHVGVQLEHLAQGDVDGAVAVAHRRGERSLEAQLGAADRVERRVGERRAGVLDAGHPAQLLVPIERRAEGAQHVERRLRDLGTDAVAADQRRRAPAHGSPGVSALTARVRAVHGSSPSPRATVRHSTRPVRTSTMTTVNSAMATGWSVRAPGSPTVRR